MSLDAAWQHPALSPPISFPGNPTPAVSILQLSHLTLVFNDDSSRIHLLGSNSS